MKNAYFFKLILEDAEPYIRFISEKNYDLAFDKMIESLPLNVDTVEFVASIEYSGRDELWHCKLYSSKYDDLLTIGTRTTKKRAVEFLTSYNGTDFEKITM